MTITALKDNEIFVDTFVDTSYYWKTDKLIKFATIGAPPGSQVDGINVEDLSQAHIDFNSQNNKNSLAITATVSVDPIISTVQGDGSANTIIRWSWVANVPSGSANEIDGFLIQIAESDTVAPVVPFPTDSVAVAYLVGSSGGKTTYIHNSTMNKYLQFKITPFRSYGTSGPKSTITGTSTTTGISRPADKLKFDNIYLKELNLTATNLLEDSVIEPYEKVAKVTDLYAGIQATNSTYSLALDKINKATNFPTNVRDDFTNSRGILLTILNTPYPIALSDDFTKDNGYKSHLVIGKDEQAIIGGVVRTGVLENHKKTHIIGESVRVGFISAVDAYESALNAVILAHQLLAVNSTNSSAVSLIDELADSVLTGKEKELFSSLLANMTKDTNNLVIQLNSKNSTIAATIIKEVLATFAAELNTKTRLTYVDSSKDYSGAVAPFLTNKAVKSKFKTSAEVITFYAALSEWNLAYEAYSGVAKAPVHISGTTVPVSPSTLPVGSTYVNTATGITYTLDVLGNWIAANLAASSTIDGTPVTEVTKVVDTIKYVHKSDGSTVAPPTNVTITYSSADANDDGKTDAIISWSWAGLEDTIDGFIVETRRNKNSAGLAQQVSKQSHPKTSADARSITVLDLGTTLYNVASVYAYRIVSKEVYSVAPAAQKGFGKLSLGSTRADSSVGRYVGALVIAGYVAMNRVSDTPPVSPRTSDYWLNSSATTQLTVPPLTWGQWMGSATGYRVLSDDESDSRLPAKAGGGFIIVKVTEPVTPEGLNKPGFFWKNSSGKPLSGVPKDQYAYWDTEDKIWKGGFKPGTWSGTSYTIAALTLEHYPIEGSLYIGFSGTARRLYKAQNGLWTTFVTKTSGYGTASPVVSLTVLTYLDTDSFKYYTRKSVTATWGNPVDLFTKRAIISNVIPTKAKNAP